MPRCPNGTRRNKKTGECEPIGAKSASVKASSETSSKTTKSKRCPKGTRRNKKTGNCDPIKKSSSSKKSSSAKTSQDTNWRIYEIEYRYPSIASNDKIGLSRDDRGIMNIENIYIENDNNVAIIAFENKTPEISLGKKQNTHPKIAWDQDTIMVNNNIKQRFINAALNSDISNIKFVGMESDEDGNYTTKRNVKDLKNGIYGKYIKINISGNNYGENLNAENKDKVLQEVKNLLNTV
jgi:hypothetical protein